MAKKVTFGKKRYYLLPAHDERLPGDTGMVRRLRENQDDLDLWGVYADLVEEHGEQKRADFIRKWIKPVLAVVKEIKELPGDQRKNCRFELADGALFECNLYNEGGFVSGTFNYRGWVLLGTIFAAGSHVFGHVEAIAAAAQEMDRDG